MPGSLGQQVEVRGCWWGRNDRLWSDDQSLVRRSIYRFLKI